MSESSMSDIQDDGSETVVHRSRHDPTGETALSTSVLVALDSIPGFDLENSDTVIFDHVDLDALDELFRPVSGGRRTGRVTFPVDGYEVTATADGEITIRTT